MSLIKWRDSYDTGVQQFDEEHYKIVEFIDTIFDALRTECTKETLDKVISELILYTEYHFANEEEAMRGVDFPFYDEHLAEHKKLREEVLEYQTKIENEFPKGTAELYRFLREWLMRHIQETDMKYGPYLKDNKGKGQQDSGA